MGFISGMKRRYRASALAVILFAAACAVGDSTPPGTIEDLTSTVLTRILTWTAPGDNGNSGRATIYFPRYLDNVQIAQILGVPSLDGIPFEVIQQTVIDNFDLATQVPDFEEPLPAGQTENFLIPRIDILGQLQYFFSVRTNDEVGNSSRPSNVAELTTGIQNVTYVSSDPGSCLGQSIAAGNYNGDQNQNNDGFFISVNDYAIGDPCLGRVYIFFGQNNLTDNGNPVVDVSTADVTIIGNTGEEFGASLATAAHFESDPRTDELVIGAPEFNGGTGKVYVVFGSVEFPSVIDLTDGSVEHIEIVGENPGDNFGFSLENGAGILNGRGVIMVGAPFFNASTGKVYVYKGPDLSKTSVNPATIAHATFTGQLPGGFFGFDLAILGRIESSSSFDEFGIGAPGIGRAYVIRGADNLQSKDLATDTTNVLILEGSAEDEFGFSIAGDGDINGQFNEDGEVVGDSRPDVVVGAPGANSDAGSVFLYSGEVLRDAFEDGDPIVFEAEFTGENPGDLFGSSVAVFPDLTPVARARQRDTAIVLEFEESNADFAAGAPGSAPGAVYIFFGQVDFDPVIPASAAELVLDGPEGDTFFGSVVEELLDVNGDEIDDIGVGGTGIINVYY